MRCIALHQPWASLIGAGKRIETRHWDTQIRGPIAICSARKWTKELNALCGVSPFREALISVGHMPDLYGRWNLPRGQIIATANLDACYCISAKEHTYTLPSGERVKIPPDEPELSFGGYDPGRYAFVLSNIRLMTRRIDVKCGQKWFTVPDELIWEEDLVTPEEAIEAAVGHTRVA
jgi:hypothetical protein